MQNDDNDVLTEAEREALEGRLERLRAGFAELRRAAAGEEPLFDPSELLSGEGER